MDKLLTALIRPPDIVVSGLIFYHGFFLSFFFSSAFLRTRWTELNQNRSHARKWVQFQNACPKSGVSPPPTNRGPKNHLFGRLRNSTANLMAYIFGMKHDIHKRASALQTTRGLLHRVKTTWTLVHKWLQTGSEFSHTLHKFCIPLHCQASQTEISKRNSTKLCQTVDDRSRSVSYTHLTLPTKRIV